MFELSLQDLGPQNIQIYVSICLDEKEDIVVFLDFRKIQ